MGVVPLNARNRRPISPDMLADFGEGTTLAVTLEQKGGSPTGVAQGPIVAVARRRSRRADLAATRVRLRPSRRRDGSLPKRRRRAARVITVVSERHTET